MIVMLDCSELDTEVSDAGIETVEFNDCRGVSKKNGDTNSMLAMMREGARFFCKDRWKFINPFTQSISRLCQVSQLYPRTKEHSYNYYWKKVWVSWQFQRWCCLMNYQTGREQLEELQMSSGDEYPQI